MSPERPNNWRWSIEHDLNLPCRMVGTEGEREVDPERYASSRHRNAVSAARRSVPTSRSVTAARGAVNKATAQHPVENPTRAGSRDCGAGRVIRTCAPDAHAPFDTTRRPAPTHQTRSARAAVQEKFGADPHHPLVRRQLDVQCRAAWLRMHSASPARAGKRLPVPQD